MATKKRGEQPSAAVMAALARHGFPTRGGPGLCFTAEGDALYARGYPAIRLLSDERIAEDKATAQAERALDAIDPCLRVTIPRELARQYLRGHSVGVGLYVDETSGPRDEPKRRERRARMTGDHPVDIALFDEALAVHGVAMGDTYSRWRWPEVVFLYEAFLGTEPVARALVAHLVREADDLSRWGFAANDVGRTNAAPCYLALALPGLFARLDGAVVDALRAALGRATPPSSEPAPGEPAAYRSLLQTLAGAPTPARWSELFRDELALRGEDPRALATSLDASEHALLWNVGRVAWVLGTAPLARALSVGGHDLPAMVDAVAPIKDPGIVRLMAAIAAQRAGARAAAQWLRVHAAYARPILRDLAALDDAKEKKNATAARALLDDETPVKVKVPTAAELAREIAAIFARLKTQLRRTPDVAKQKAAIREAHEAYVEARAAAGDPSPEAYFTHRFGDFELGPWAMLAVDALDE